MFRSKNAHQDALERLQLAIGENELRASEARRQAAETELQIAGERLAATRRAIDKCESDEQPDVTSDSAERKLKLLS